MNETINNAEYAAVMEEISRLIGRGVRADTPCGDRLPELAEKARTYENARFPMAASDPVSAIKFRMDQQGLQARDLIPYLGTKSRVYEVLSGKRPLTLPMIRSLHQGLGIPAESLIAEPAPVANEDEQVA